MKPRILISATAKSDFYREAVESAGGEAVLRTNETDDTGFDGLLLAGGSDVHPRFYGEEINGSVGIDEARDVAELTLFRAFAASKKPILGICRGHQVINVALGGTLCQHLPEAARHIPLETGDAVHSIRAEENSVLADLYGTEFSVNSAHHQATAHLGDGLRVTAWAENVVEAVEHAFLPILGVQFHPERMCGRRLRPDTVSGAPIFAYFIAQAQGKE